MPPYCRSSRVTLVLLLAGGWTGNVGLVAKSADETEGEMPVDALADWGPDEGEW